MPHRYHRVTIAAAAAVVVLSSLTAGAASVAVSGASPSPSPPAASLPLPTPPDATASSVPHTIIVAQAETAEVDVADRALIRSLQQALAALGFDPGPVDGLIGPRTRAAVREYQRASGLPDDGRITRPLLADIASRITAARQPERAAPGDSEATAEDPLLSEPSAPAAPHAPGRDG